MRSPFFSAWALSSGQMVLKTVIASLKRVRMRLATLSSCHSC